MGRLHQHQESEGASDRERTKPGERIKTKLEKKKKINIKKAHMRRINMCSHICHVPKDGQKNRTLKKMKARKERGKLDCIAELAPCVSADRLDYGRTNGVR